MCIEVINDSQEFEYPDLQITREQNFFYSIGMRWCRDLGKQVWDLITTYL